MLGNTSGGVKQGATYEGRLDATLDIDTEKLANWKNGTIHAKACQIHGRGLSGNNLFDLFTTSGIEAYPDTKLYEVWYEHKFLDGRLLVRGGQLAADTEFFTSQTAAVFINGSFGWPSILANNLPNARGSLADLPPSLEKGAAHAGEVGIDLAVVPAGSARLLKALLAEDALVQWKVAVPGPRRQRRGHRLR